MTNILNIIEAECAERKCYRILKASYYNDEQYAHISVDGVRNLICVRNAGNDTTAVVSDTGYCYVLADDSDDVVRGKVNSVLDGLAS